MRSLGNYIVSGRWQAIWVVSLVSLISLPISGVLVSLVTLRRGALSGVEVITGSTLSVLALSLLTGMNPMNSLAHVLGSWVPLYICSLVLRQSEQQGKLVAYAGGFGLLFILLMRSVVADVDGFWRSTFETQLLANLPEDVLAQYKTALELVMPMMNAIVFASFVVGLIVTVLLARWWQSYLFNPGGFRTEFRQLQLPGWVALLAAPAIFVLLLGNEQIGLTARDCLVIVAFMYAFQGLATVHRTVGLRDLGKTWLIFMYALLFVIPQMMVLFLAFIGIADGWKQKHKDISGNDDS